MKIKGYCSYCLVKFTRTLTHTRIHVRSLQHSLYERVEENDCSLFFGYIYVLIWLIFMYRNSLIFFSVSNSEYKTWVKKQEFFKKKYTNMFLETQHQEHNTSYESGKNQWPHKRKKKKKTKKQRQNHQQRIKHKFCRRSLGLGQHVRPASGFERAGLTPSEQLLEALGVFELALLCRRVWSRYVWITREGGRRDGVGLEGGREKARERRRERASEGDKEGGRGR